MRLYPLLLHLYPSAYRAEYGADMAAIFDIERQSASGPLAVAALWLNTFGDVLVNAAALHLEIAARDFRYSFRSLLRSPGFAITAVLLIAIGVGANAAIFTLADFVLVRPLPFPQPDRLVKVWERHPGYDQMELSPANYRDLLAAASSFQSFAVYNANSMNLVGHGEPQRVRGTAVSSNLFATLQAAPWIGRTFSTEDSKPGSPKTVVLSYALWQTQFSGDAAVLGKSVFLDDQPYAIIGVMPADFRFPARDALLWVPYQFTEDDYQDRNNNYLAGIARLKPGTTMAQARNETALIAARMEKQFPKENKDVGINVLSLRDEVTSQSRLLLAALCGAALCVLIIACANLANLLLARSLTRKKEIAVRMSLGAHPRQIMRQMLTESFLLGSAGAIGAVILAAVALPLLSRLVPNGLPIEQVPPIDFRLLLVALVLTIVTVVAFALVPALHTCRGVFFDGLREGSRSSGSGSQRARSALVVAEVIVSVVLLISSGLLVRALWRVQATDPGFKPDNLLTMQTPLSFPKFDKTSTREAFYTQVLNGIRALPGVKDAAYTSGLPMTWGGGIWPVVVNGDLETRTAGTSASLRFVTTDYFSTMNIPLLNGRLIEESDTSDRPYVAIVSESFVRRYWPGEDPIGKHFTFAFHDREVVGIVRDIRVRGLERTSEPQVYIGYKQVPDGYLTFYAPKDLAVRSQQQPGELVPGIREIIHKVNPEQPISNVQSMNEILADQTESRTVQMRVLIIFTAVAIFLAGLGIYGLLSFAVSMRRQEFGIRMALGAQNRDIFGIVLRQGAWLGLAGLAPGLFFAYGAAKLLQNLLAGVKPDDAVTFSAAAAICLVTVLIGALVPALRAVRVDPASVMRVE